MGSGDDFIKLHVRLQESTLNMVKKLLERRELRPREAGAIKDCVGKTRLMSFGVIASSE